MEFEFPRYPFIWDYMDMYNQIDYQSKVLDKDDFDEHILFLIKKFPNSKIIESIQTIKSIENVKNLNIHTWYLSHLNVFETTELNIKIITNSTFKYKSNVNCFIFDPYDIFDNSIFEFDKKFNNVAVIKNKKSIIPSLIPKLYIHIHNINGILRFSPNDNNKINLKKHINHDINLDICYIILDKLIVKFKIIVI